MTNEKNELTVSIPLADLRRLYTLLGHFNSFLHQPLHYEDKEYIKSFATTHYPELRELYYQTVWNLFPEDVQREITEEDEE